MITDTTDFSASRTTSNTTAEMAEMQAIAKSTASNLKKLTTLVATMTSTNSGGGNQQKHCATSKCKNCKREVYHKGANFLKSEANRENLYASWKSVFVKQDATGYKNSSADVIT